MSQYWFKPRMYGYGATPTTWKGWVAVAVYLTSVLALTLSLVTWPVEMSASAKAWQVATWAMMVALLTVGVIRFTRAKTDGQWRSRWGK
jgi:hypothetical protein